VAWYNSRKIRLAIALNKRWAATWEVGMSEVRARSVEEIIASLVPKFIEDVRDTLCTLNDQVEALRKPETQAEAANDFMRQVHGIKGTAGTFGFSFIAVICHKLEDYMIRTPIFTRKETDDILVFLQAIESILQRGSDPADDEGFRIFRSLPSYIDLDKFVMDVKPVQSLFIGPRDVQFLIIERQLSNCGIRSTNASKSLQAIELAVRTRPDLVMVSNIIDSISGTEVANVLNSINATKAIPIMFIISEIDIRDDGRRLREVLPSRVRIVRKGVKFPDDFADALVALNIL
jgi:HPt (histidine-containing phosphotransfer) domain-containing protein